MSLSHQKSDLRIYRIWKGMRARCNNKNVKQYKDYGGRGISICKEWDDFQNFYDWSIENGYLDKLTIDRKDVNGDYSPDNCQWITQYEQNQNRRNSIILFYKRDSYTPLELLKIINVSINTIYDIHKRMGLTDFTDYNFSKPKEKYIFERSNGFEVTIKKKYCGKYKTLQEAIDARDRILKIE